MSAALSRVTPVLTRGLSLAKPFVHAPARPEADFTSLLNRMRQRAYPETARVLAFYWLRTVCGRGYTQREWKTLVGLLAEFPRKDPTWSQTGLELQSWIGQTGFSPVPRQIPVLQGPATSNLSHEVLVPYIVRLLNEWLPVEVARLLVDEPDTAGMPVLTIARGIERLLVRERLSTGSLESLLEAGLLSPRIIYPCDMEVLRDVVLFLLDRTEAPEPSVLPAVLLCVTPDSHLGKDYEAAVIRARLISDGSREELHVPIAQMQANELLRADPIHLGSILVTMDGRWWQADRLLEDGEQVLIVHDPGGRLEIDHSGDHARLRIPWPETRAGWAGQLVLPESFAIFGRQWRVERWERDSEQTQLHLVFLRTLPVSKVAPVAADGLHRSRPAAADIAWASLENALASGYPDAIEQLRHTELIPVGRAICGLIECVMSGHLRDEETVATRLRSIAYLQAELMPSYGKVPWRILPEPVRKRVLRGAPCEDLWAGTFEGSPQASPSGS